MKFFVVLEAPPLISTPPPGAHQKVAATLWPRVLMSRVAGKRVAFTVARPLPPDAFAGLVVTALDVSDGRVRFLTSEPETALRRLFERGVEPHDLEVAGADLEEAVLSLTRRPEGA